MIDPPLVPDSKSIYYYQSETEKSKQMKAHADRIADLKMIEIRERELMIKQICSKLEKFKKLSEKALRGNIDPLVSGVIAERRAYDQELLTEFLKSSARAIMEGLKCDVAATISVASSIVHSLKDEELIMARIVQAQRDIEDWVAQIDKQRSLPSIWSSLNI